MTRARPPVGIISVERMRNSVVFPLPLGPSKPEQFGRPHVEAHAIQSCAALVPVNEILNRNDGRGGSGQRLPGRNL